MDNSYADAKHLVSRELFTDKINACITALGGTPGTAPGAENNYADKQHLISREIFNAKMNELAAAISGGGAGWKYFTWNEGTDIVSFGDNETRDYYLNTPEPFYVTASGGEVRLAVITNVSGGNPLFTYTVGNNVYSLAVMITPGAPDGEITLDWSTVSYSWSMGSMRTLPLTASAETGEVLAIGEDGFPQWRATRNLFPTVTITQEELGAQIMLIGAFAAQANDAIKMKTFSFTGTAGSSIIDKILAIIESGVGFIKIEGFGVQALAYKMSQNAVSTTQTFGYFSDPTQPFLFSADYVIQDVTTGDVDLNFYVQKINVVT